MYIETAYYIRLKLDWHIPLKRKDIKNKNHSKIKGQNCDRTHGISVDSEHEKR